MKFSIEYSPEVEDHLRIFTARQQKIILDTVDNQLAYQPDVETKNRKPMRPNPIAPWELRIGNFRVYYDIEYEPKAKIYIRAVGLKKRNFVIIGKEVIPL